MKFKICCVIFILVTLCGCGGNKVVTPAMNNIDFTAQIQFADEHYVCDVSICDKNTDIRVLKPQELEGLTFHFAPNEAYAEYLGIKYTPNAGNMPSGGVVTVLNDIIWHINNENITAASKEGNCSLEGKLGDDEFIFMFSPSGLPLELKMVDKDYTVKFNNVTIK